MDDYILILRHEDGTKVAPPEQLEIWMQQTQEWISTIEKKGKFIAGIALPFDEAWVVWPENMITNGPFGDRKQTIGGIITVRANSHEDVTEFAKGCPVLQGEGNSVEVRKIAPSSPPTSE